MERLSFPPGDPHQTPATTTKPARPFVEVTYTTACIMSSRCCLYQGSAGRRGMRMLYPKLRDALVGSQHLDQEEPLEERVECWTDTARVSWEAGPVGATCTAVGCFHSGPCHNRYLHRSCGKGRSKQPQGQKPEELTLCPVGASPDTPVAWSRRSIVGRSASRAVYSTFLTARKGRPTICNGPFDRADFRVHAVRRSPVRLQRRPPSSSTHLNRQALSRRAVGCAMELLRREAVVRNRRESCSFATCYCSFCERCASCFCPGGRARAAVYRHAGGRQSQSAGPCHSHRG